MQIFEPEQVREGVHFGQLVVEPGKQSVRRILQRLDAARLTSFLAVHPLSRIDVLQDFRRPEIPRLFHETLALYERRQQRVYLNYGRPLWTFGEDFAPGTNLSMSSTGKDREDAVGRSLVHEVGHHLLNVGGEAMVASAKLAAQKGHPISDRARRNWQEYFCETLCAEVFHPDALREFDPIGYAMLEEVRLLML